MYNRGDIKGCAEIYEQAAGAALQTATEGEQMRLRAGLQSARSSASENDVAWALRRAFDDVLAGTSSQAGFGISQVNVRTGASGVGYTRCLQNTQIAMGLTTLGFSLYFIGTVAGGHFNDGGQGRPMRAMEYLYAIIFFALGVPLGITAAAGGFLYYRPGVQLRFAAILNLVATIICVGDIIAVFCRIALHENVRDKA
jgi:hypothetical protein